jgi:hypothetical protein
MELGRSLRELSHLVVGWRVWTVRETPVGLRLASVLHDVLWATADAAVASCRRDEDPFAAPLGPHPVPAAICNCGFHAARDATDVLSYLRGRDEPETLCRILGEVALWGNVIVTEGGWRASMAYPTRLYCGDEEIAEALSVYDVPVVSRACVPASATSSRSVSAGSWRSSWSAVRTCSSQMGGSG